MPGASGMTIEAPGHEALRLIDQVLAEMPKRNDHALSQATVCLSAFRDGLTDAWRRGGLAEWQRMQLSHVNAVITVVLGTHFPLGEIPWHELDKARGWLAEAVAMIEPVS